MRHTIPLLFVIAIAAACGDSEKSVPETSTAAELPELDACELFTAEDASAVLGVPANSPEGWTRMDNRNEQHGMAMSNCMYASADGRRTAHVVIVHSARSGYPSTWEELEASAASGSGQMAGMSAELLEASVPAPVGGEFGYWTPELGTLTLFSGGKWMITATADPPTPGDAAARSAAENAIQRVLERL